jgi:transposase
MSTTPEREAEIVRLYFAEHWRVGTIAAQLGVHPDVVRRVLGIGESRAGGAPRPRLVDPYRGFIAETFARYPRLCATRLYDMLADRGYAGAVRTLREYVAEVRPRPRREVYLRTEPLSGEQAQIDWAYVGKLAVPGGERALWLFVMVLSYSRALWGEFVIDLTVHSLTRSLVRAACALGGVTRQWLFDNPKVVVLERRGDVVRFHPTLLELCGAMRVEPRLCAVARPEHKGKVERAIRYVRDRFLAGRTITGIAEGNTLLGRFLAEIASARPHPVLAPRTVGEVFADERARLLPLPTPLPPTDLVTPIGCDRQAFVRFDTNRYSVPTTLAERTLTLCADDVDVRVLDGPMCVARHPRSWGRRQILELSGHRAVLVAERRAAADLKGRDRLRAAAPAFGALLERWALAGPSLGMQVTRAIKLLDLYGDEVFAVAVAELVARGLRDTGALAVACDRLRRERHRPVPIDVPLPAHADDRDVIPHDLETYDDDDE